MLRQVPPLMGHCPCATGYVYTHSLCTHTYVCMHTQACTTQTFTYISKLNSWLEWLKFEVCSVLKAESRSSELVLHCNTVQKQTNKQTNITSTPSSCLASSLPPYLHWGLRRQLSFSSYQSAMGQKRAEAHTGSKTDAPCLDI